MTRQVQAGLEVGRWRRVRAARIKATLLPFISPLAKIRERRHASGLARRVLFDPLRAVHRIGGLHVASLLGSELFDGAPVYVLLLAPGFGVVLLRGGNQCDQ